MTSCIQKTEKGVRLCLHVQPKSSKTGWGELIVHEGKQWLQIKVNAPPVNGAANKAVIKFLAKEFKVAKSRIGLIQGEKSRYKVFLLNDLNAGNLQMFAQRFHLHI